MRTYIYRVRKTLEDDDTLNGDGIDVLEAQVDLNLFSFAICFFVFILDWDDTNLVLVGVNEVVEISSRAEGVGGLLSVEDNEHLVQVAYRGLLIVVALGDPKVYC